MPSQPFSPSLAMNARRLGVSTIWAMFSRVRSKTSGSSFASRNASTSSRNASCSGEKSKSIRPPSLWSQPDPDDPSDRGTKWRVRSGVPVGSIGDATEQNVDRDVALDTHQVAEESTGLRED